MPELPEVETTVSSLKKEVLGRTFVRAWSESNFNKIKSVKGKCIKNIYRKGKCIVFVFSEKEGMFAHLRMTGHFLVGKWEMVDGKWKSEEKMMNDKRNGHLRFVFFLDDGRQLSLSDQRKFAEIYTAPLKEIEKYLNLLGPDMLSVRENLFVDMIRSKKRAVKPLLLDQRFIAGIGNIYASEALFVSGIYPGKQSCLIPKEDLRKLYSNLIAVMKKSICLKGDSTSDYRLLDGKKGGYQNEHLVYNRRGEKCVCCSEKIRRVTLGGRGTYYCPNCQKS